MTMNDRAIAGALLAAILASCSFIVAYATTGDRLWEGLSLAIAAAALCAAAVGWAVWILPPAEVVDEREDPASGIVDRTNEGRELDAGAAELSRSSALVRLLYGALGAFALACIAPIRSLGGGTISIDALFHTKWRRGSRLAREDGTPLHRDELNVDSVVTVFPEHAIGDAQSETVLIRLPDGAGDGGESYVAYSKVCTHAGCAVALYRAKAKQLMCPCHQSVFDVLDEGAVVSGPADRALPRLPIAFDAGGYLIATDDFPRPVGPGFWENG